MWDHHCPLHYPVDVNGMLSKLQGINSTYGQSEQDNAAPCKAVLHGPLPVRMVLLTDLDSPAPLVAAGVIPRAVSHQGSTQWGHRKPSQPANLAWLLSWRQHTNDTCNGLRPTTAICAKLLARYAASRATSDSATSSHRPTRVADLNAALLSNASSHHRR